MQAIICSLQASLFERAFKLRLLTLQELKRLGAIDGDVGGHLPVSIDAEPDVDAAKLGRIEAYVELIDAALNARGDCHGKPRDRNGSRHGRRC